MKYVFFDIECSNGHDICSFGYCKTDENFKILKKEDIVINPESKITLAPHDSQGKMELAYSQEYFLKQNPFDFYYPKIKELLTNEKHVLFGHSIGSDFGFLNIACRRYKLPLFEIEGYDTQKLHYKIYKTEHLESLEKIVEELGVEKTFLYHKSSEDAEATMYVAKTIFQENDISLSSPPDVLLECLVKNNLTTIKKKKTFADKVNDLRQAFLDREHIKCKVAFSDGFKIKKTRDQLYIIRKLFEAGYDYTNKILNCDVFILDGQEGNRYNFYKYLRSRGKQLKSRGYDDLMKEIFRSNREQNEGEKEQSKLS